MVRVRVPRVHGRAPRERGARRLRTRSPPPASDDRLRNADFGKIENNAAFVIC